MSQTKIHPSLDPQTREPQTREPQTREPQTREPQTREPQTREPQTREPQTRNPQTRNPQAREPQTREPQTRDPQILDPQTRDRLLQLTKQADQGDQSVLPELRQLLDNHPGLWQQRGDLALHVEHAWLGRMAGKTLSLRECLERKIDELKSELCGSEPSPLERLLVQRIVIAWLQIHCADINVFNAKDPVASPAQIRELQRHQESVERRYQASIKQLALVRKLLRPTLAPLDIAARLNDNESINRRGVSPRHGLAIVN